jgi:Mn-dependent DtxR family transcriptional regulator
MSVAQISRALKIEPLAVYIELGRMADDELARYIQ